MTDKLKIVIEITNTGLEEDILRKGEWEDDSLFGRSLRNALMQFTKGNEWIVDILDKITTEIMQLDYDLESVDFDYNDMPQTELVHMICREEVLQIIDKHKERSEV